MAATEDLVGLLEQSGVEYELLSHERTERAAAEAEALGVASEDVAKTLVISAPDGNVRAVILGSDRISMSKLCVVLGSSKKRTHLATEEALEQGYPEFELGAVPPFGGSQRDPVLVDARVAERDSVVVEAGSHVESLRIKTADLVRLTDAQVVDLVQE
jgi:Ala-tRNA(Pro) deacylase